MSGTQPVAGAAVTVVVTGPNGGKTTLQGTSGTDGIARLKISLKRSPKGVYQVQATSKSSGVSGMATTSFVVQ